MTEIEKLQKQKKDLLQKVKPMVKIKQKLEKQSDISEPMSPKEKAITKEIATIFSEINILVGKINKLKRSKK